MLKFLRIFFKKLHFYHNLSFYRYKSVSFLSGDLPFSGKQYFCFGLSELEGAPLTAVQLLKGSVYSTLLFYTHS